MALYIAHLHIIESEDIKYVYLDIIAEQILSVLLMGGQFYNKRLIQKIKQAVQFDVIFLSFFYYFYY